MLVTPQRAARVLSALEDDRLDDIDLMMCNSDGINSYATSKNRALRVSRPFESNFMFNIRGKSHSDHFNVV